MKKKCRPVTNFDDRLAELLDDMIETLADAQGTAWRPAGGSDAPRVRQPG
ncbi:MAG: hypothetical protein ACLSWY_04065 [Ruthenibacterium lactatiformans]